uniref:Uncharacterized protein n=1 Tax=Dreissena rostriformis TaxID=205083 RepID=A0A894JLK3_9BIVA|nr:hypothetical protein K8L31_mgp11 [Dreissena rostriformis]QRV59731.1 hypothetical protein [Dreissena rostriformis]
MLHPSVNQLLFSFINPLVVFTFFSPGLYLDIKSFGLFVWTIMFL